MPPPRRNSTAQITLRFVVLAAVATLIVGSLLAVQMANGSDPTLGPKAAAKAKKSAGKPAASGSSTGATETDPYADGGYTYGSSGSSGYSSGYSAQSVPAPVTSSTS
jgi:uncharacterized membrane protein